MTPVSPPALCATCGHVLDVHFGGENGTAYPPCHAPDCGCSRWRPPAVPEPSDDASPACAGCGHPAASHDALGCKWCLDKGRRCETYRLVSDEERHPYGRGYDLGSDWKIKAARTSQPAIVPGALGYEGLTIVSGVSGAGKSTLVLDALLSYTLGLERWHGRPIAEGHRPGILIFDGENAESIITTRALAWQEKHGLSERQLGRDPVEGRVMVVPEPQFLINGGTPLWEIVKHYQDEWIADGGVPFGVVMLDTYGALSAFDDGNSAAQAQAIVRELLQVWERLHILPLALSHPSDAGAIAIEEAMNNGRAPAPVHAILGSSVTYQRASHVTVVAEDREHPDRILLCARKTRSLEGSSRVYSLRREDSPCELQNEPHGQWLSAPVFVGEFELVPDKLATGTAAAAPVRAAFLSWLEERDGWATTDDLEGTPFKPDTVQKYLANAQFCAEAGIHVDRSDGKRRFRIGEPD